MEDELTAFTKDMDRCWIKRWFTDLSRFIADDVVTVAPGGKHRMHGLETVIESYREFMNRCAVKRFQTSDYVVTRRGPAAVVEYNWDMAWSDQGAKHEAKGREILMPARREDGWRVVWRTQIPA